MNNQEMITVVLSMPDEAADYHEELRLRYFLEVAAAQLSPDSEVFPPMGGGPSVEPEPIQMFIAFASSGLVTASIKGFYDLLKGYLDYRKGRELTVVRGDKQVRLKGHNEEEEIRILKLLFPEVSEGED